MQQHAHQKNYQRTIIIDALLEYLIAILVSGSFLASLLKAIGVSDAVTGVISSIVSLTCITRLFSGTLASRIRHPKRAYLALNLINQLLFSSLYLIPFFNFSPAVKTAIFVVMMLSAEFILCVQMPGKHQWFYTYVPYRERGRFAARQEIVSLIGGMIWSMAMGYVSDTLRDAGHERLSFGVLAICLFVTTFLYMFNLMRGMDESVCEVKKSVSFTAGFRLIRSDKDIRRLLVFDVLHNVANYMAVPYFGTYLIGELGFSLTTVSLFSVLYSVVRTLVSPLFGRMIDKKGFVYSLSVSTLILAASFFINTVTSPAFKWTYIIYYALFAVSGAIMNQAYTNVTYEYVPDDQFADLFGVRSAIGGTIGFAASLLSSLIVSRVQAGGNLLFGHTFYAQQLLSCVSGVLYLLLFLYIHFVLKRHQTIKRAE